MPFTELRQTTQHLYLQCSPQKCPSILSYITLCESEWYSDVLVPGEDVFSWRNS